MATAASAAEGASEAAVDIVMRIGVAYETRDGPSFRVGNLTWISWLECMDNGMQ